MERAEIEELRNDLNARRQELESVLERDTEQLNQQLGSTSPGEGHVDFNHPADMVGGDPDFDKELRLLAHEREEIAAIDKALQRMDEGSYLRCEECGGEISSARLKAIPFTSHCVDCQNLLDQEQQKLQRNQGARH